MAYSLDLRKKVINYVENGGSPTKAAKVFQVGRASIYRWLERVEAIEVKTRKRKIDYRALKQDVETNPEARLIDRAKQFKVRPSAISYALKKMKITRKSGATPLGFPEQGNAHQDKTASVSRKKQN